MFLGHIYHSTIHKWPFVVLVQGYLKSQSVYFKTQENSKYPIFLLDCVVIDIGGSVVNIKGQELVLLLRNSFFIA